MTREQAADYIINKYGEELKRCEFCAYMNQNIAVRYLSEEPKRIQYYSGLASQMTYKGNKFGVGFEKSTFDLNYCPVCGKKIEQTEFEIGG